MEIAYPAQAPSRNRALAVGSLDGICTTITPTFPPAGWPVGPLPDVWKSRSTTSRCRNLVVFQWGYRTARPAEWRGYQPLNPENPLCSRPSRLLLTWRPPRWPRPRPPCSSRCRWRAQSTSRGLSASPRTRPRSCHLRALREAFKGVEYPGHFDGSGGSLLRKGHLREGLVRVWGLGCTVRFAVWGLVYDLGERVSYI